ncbi:SdrD B-like domain-containing protein [Brumicola nitratireducens]|uniref:Sporulation related protein n=1 Tax=Glaciecola nitratireducens (strain JCM 12485 / KCTC 12276 / FR1064) TaxID=1085623 RepID=G4QKQ4_GLANF|nr:SdrD B-like domain-containing protein [Glaciecola nitratireducens]AEP30357.1 sporulation related protein [Glaciecola nitratireducens FR1064]
MLKKLQRWLLLLVLLPVPALAERLVQVELSDDEYLLVDVVLNNNIIARSIDLHQVEGKRLIAIEPILDALKVRYLLSGPRLTVWHQNSIVEFELLGAESDNATNLGSVWATDGFYMFVQTQVFEQLFSTQLNFNSQQLKVEITTGRDNAIFPIQVLSKQAQNRALDRLTEGYTAPTREQIPITIDDQYRAFTVPHGRINIAAEQSDEGSGFNSSLQLTSDLLYHSAQLTLTDSKNAELQARLQLSRYKTSPDDYILGLYDQYQFGDISSRTNNLTSGTQAGVGIIFERREESFRDSNQFITLKETAPPGWEAELFRNQVFLQATTVPDDGLLIFDDVEVTYGSNQYVIKLYGPFGEKDVINKSYNLVENALSKGQTAHTVYALDRKHRLINDQSDEDYEPTDFGGTFDYGVSDNWQIGVGYAGLVGDQRVYSLSNAVSLPGMLLENDISVDQDGNYAQLTSIQGSAFGNDRYNINFESGSDFTSDRLSLIGDSIALDGAYYFNTDYMGVTFGGDYRKDDLAESYRISNRISGSWGRLLLRHSLTYAKNISLIGNMLETENLLGSVGVSGSLPYNFRVSANINYDPDASDIIQDSSSLVIQKNLVDPWDTTHYLTLNYLPIASGERDNWRLSHRASWRTGDFQLNLASQIGDNGRWSIQLGLQMFLGYDYRNNRVTLSQRLLPNTASLDVHAYLDRQINGIPDPLDYDLSGVEFSGNPEWGGVTTGEGGRAILPGVYPNSPFRFAAKWKQGSSTINNDYVVFSHPGAYIDVNMPFILSTELLGFVLRTNSGQEIGLQNAVVELYDDNNQKLRSKETDIDGYYEFLGLAPGQYRVEINKQTLTEKGYTGNVVGFNVITGGKGGYAELPALILRRIGDDKSLDLEQIEDIALDKESSEATVWDPEEKVRRNYFTLPTKNKVVAKHSLDEDKLAELTELEQKAELKADFTNVSSAAAEKFAFLNKSESNLPSVSILEPHLNDNKVTVFKAQQIMGAKSQIQTSSKDVKGGFVIQLGVYKDLVNAQDLINRLASEALPKNQFTLSSDKGMTRVLFGSFLSMASGLEFANKFIGNQQAYLVKASVLSSGESESESVETSNKPWVIQLYAASTEAIEPAIINQFTAIENLNLGQKRSDNGNIVYCIISSGLTTKAAAQKVLQNSGYNGWVVNAGAFENVRELKRQ